MTLLLLSMSLQKKKGFYDAKSTCQRQGGDLVIISDRNEFVKNLFWVVDFVVFCLFTNLLPLILQIVQILLIV